MRCFKSNKWEKQEQVKRVAAQLDITEQLAKELLILSKGDEELVFKASEEGATLPEVKAIILNERMSRNEG